MRFRWRCVLVLAACAATAAQAQTYPTRPLRIIVPYPPGASTDYTARLIGGRLTDAFGQSVVVENRGGAGGIVAKLNAAINAALQADDLKKLLIAQGSNPQPLSVEEFTRFVRSDCPNWARAVKIAGLKPE